MLSARALKSQLATYILIVFVRENKSDNNSCLALVIIF
jgi:hypothetical protein